jgi:integrase
MAVTLKKKPNGIYYLDTQLPNDAGGLKRVRISLDTRDKTEADAQRRDWLAGLHPKHPARGGAVAPKGRAVESNGSTSATVDPKAPTVHLWLTKCLSDVKVWGKCKATANHRSNVRILCDLIPADKLVADVSSADVYELERVLRDEKGYAEASIRKLLGSLSSALRRAAQPDCGLIAQRPMFPSISVDNVQDRVIMLDEEKAMWECIEERIHAEPMRQWRAFKRLLIVLLDTGCRLGEVLHSGPSSIKRKPGRDSSGRDVEGVWLHLPKHITKSGKARDVPLTARLRAMLPELAANAAAGRWFPWRPASSGPLYFLQAIRRDMKERGYSFDDVKLHTFRHTCATRLAEGRMDLVSLRDWLGHSDIKITAQRYLHLMNAHIWVGAAILDAYGGTLPSTSGNGQENGSVFSKVEDQSGGRDRAAYVTPVAA